MKWKTLGKIDEGVLRLINSRNEASNLIKQNHLKLIRLNVHNN